MNTIFITILFLAEMTSHIHCYYNHNTNKQTAGYNYSKPQVVSSAWLFWWQDSNFFLQLHFLLPFRVCRVQALFSMKACHLPLKSVAALQHLTRLKESLQSVKLINWEEMLKWQMLHFYHYADMVGTNLIGGIRELYSYIFIYPYTWVP